MYQKTKINLEIISYTVSEVECHSTEHQHFHNFDEPRMGFHTDISITLLFIEQSGKSRTKFVTQIKLMNDGGQCYSRIA